MNKEQVLALKAFDKEPRRSFQVEGGPIIYLSELCDLAAAALSGPAERITVVRLNDKEVAAPCALDGCALMRGQATSFDKAGADDGWISVKDRLPAKESYVLVYGPDGMETAHYIGGDTWSWQGVNYSEESSNHAYIAEVNYWRPLPAEPKSDATEGRQG